MKKTEKSNVKSTLSLLLQYNNFVQKRRSPLVEQAIKKLIQEEKNLVTLITKITEIDEESSDTDIEFIPIKKLPPKTTRAKKIYRSNHLKFIFTTRKQLLNQVKKNPLYTPHWFGLKYSQSRQIHLLLSEFQKNALKYLIPTTQKILESSWEFLFPDHYNNFYYLHHFLINFCSNFDNSSDLKKTIYFLDSFIRDYLVLFSKKTTFAEIYYSKL
jgi:hypothetical protein